MKVASIFGFCATLLGCIATHEPIVAPLLRSTPLEASVSVIVTPGEYPDIDTSLCETVVSDLQSSGFFSAVLPCGAKNAADIVAVASWYTARTPESWCTADNSIGLSLLTAGIVPACSCPSGYALDFTSPNGATQEVLMEREACTLFGWGPVFLNLSSEYHWRGPVDGNLRAAHLRNQLENSRDSIAALLVP